MTIQEPKNEVDGSFTDLTGNEAVDGAPGDASVKGKIDSDDFVYIHEDANRGFPIDTYNLQDAVGDSPEGHLSLSFDDGTVIVFEGLTLVSEVVDQILLYEL